MSASRRYKVRPYAINTHGVSIWYEGGTLAELYLMADSSTTVTGIPIRIAGGCWARRQLHAGIRYVPVASKLRKSPASVEQIHSVQVLDGRYLYNRSTDSGALNGRLLGSTPATRRYKVLDGGYLYNRSTDSGALNGRLLGLTPATRRYKVLDG